MTRERIVPLLVLLLAAGGVVWWFMTFEQVMEPVYVGLKGKAQEDPYLALRQLFKRSQLQVEEPAASATPDSKFERLPAGGTLILSDRRHLLMTPQRVREIVAWVEAGGHLIVEAEYPGRADPLLAAFGLARKDLVWPKPAGKPAAKKQDSEDKEDDEDMQDEADKRSQAPPPPTSRTRRAPEVADVTLPDGGRTMKVEFRAYQNLAVTTNDRWHVAVDSLGLRLATALRGKGRVSAISNYDPITYRGTFGRKEVAQQPTHLGKYDHAEFALRLVRLHPTQAQAPLRFVWCNDDVSLWTWLMEHAWLALASLAVLIVVWLARVVPRFGPLKPEPAPAEQNLSSHLQAVGRFYWKHLGPVEIYGKLRTAFAQRLAERRPGIAGRGAAERNAELAQLAGVRAEAVARALDQPAHSVGELIRNAVLLQRLSQKL